MPKKDLNREAWLTELAKMMLPMFNGFKMHPFKLTCGWPVRGGFAARNRVIGECHAKESSKGGFHEIFISPTLDAVDNVAGTAAHELAHIAAGLDAGHKGKFVVVCRHVGLTKNKPTQVMPGENLAERLRKFTDKLGPYPHTALGGVLKPAKPKSSITLVCPTCECRITMTVKWYGSAGIPTCGCGTLMESPTI